MQLTESDDAAAILDSLRRIVRGLRATAHSVERELGVSGAQLFVLLELAQEPNVSIRRLSERTLTDPSSVSVVVARLTARRLVARRRDSRDRRRRALSLTERGHELLTRAPEPFQARLARTLRELPSSRLRRMNRDLSSLVHALGVERGVAPMFFDDEPPPRSRRGA